ncbi:MAG: NUDIX hydrolase [bacterium]|nr:NUDIX hydrolase [bacterium]
MEKRETETFVALVQKIKEENLLIPNMPKDIWYAVHSILALPAAEVLMTRTGKDFLLNYRKDNDFDGWEIPGGFIGYKESLEEACLRIAKREVGLEPKFEKVITAEVWKDHPYSSAISIVCLCKVEGEPNYGQFFTEIPPNMISHHSGFIKKFLELKNTDEVSS